VEVIIWLVIIYGGFALIGALFDFIGEQNRKARIRILKYKIAEKYKSIKSFATFDIYSELMAFREITKQIAPDGIPAGGYNRYQYSHMNYELKSIDTHQDCPVCNSKMLIRINGKTGTKFLGCSRYPACTFTKGYSNG